MASVSACEASRAFFLIGKNPIPSRWHERPCFCGFLKFALTVGQVLRHRAITAPGDTRMGKFMESFGRMPSNDCGEALDADEQEFGAAA
jgi:hypothetical protein